MNSGQGVGINLRHILLVIISLTVLLLLISTTAAADQCPPPLTFPCFQHTPIIDGNDVTYGTNGKYKGQYNGNMYGHWNSGFAHSTDETYLPNPLQHDADGVARAANIVALCRSGSPTVCDQGETPKIVVVALGFSNWTKEVCGDQFAQVLPDFPHNFQADLSGEWPGAPQIPPYNPNLPCDPNTWSFSNYSQLNNNVLQFVDCAIIGAVAHYWQTDDPLSA